MQRLLSDPADRLFFLTNPDGLYTRYNGLSIGVLPSACPTTGS